MIRKYQGVDRTINGENNGRQSQMSGVGGTGCFYHCNLETFPALEQIYILCLPGGDSISGF